jgi:hypothetical protein
VTESPGAEIASASDTGARRARRLPRTATLFIALAVGDIAIRGLLLWLESITSTDGYQPTGSPVVTADLLILLPALITVRRTSAAADTPLIHWGGVAIGLTAFLTGGIGRFLGLPAEAFFVTPQTQLLEALAWTVGLILVARGLSKLNPSRPDAFAAGLANLVTGAIVVAAIARLLSFLISIEANIRVFSHFDWTGSFMSIGAVTMGQLAIAYLARKVIRGFEDPSRPETATRLGTIAAVLYGVTALTSNMLNGVETVVASIRLPEDAFVILAYMTDIALVLLVASFALGLADPLRPLPKEWDAARTT